MVSIIHCNELMPCWNVVINVSFSTGTYKSVHSSSLPWAKPFYKPLSNEAVCLIKFDRFPYGRGIRPHSYVMLAGAIFILFHTNSWRERNRNIRLKLTCKLKCVKYDLNMAVRKYYTYLKLTRYSLSILLALTKKITEVGRHVIQVTSPSVQISCRGCSKNVYRFFFLLTLLPLLLLLWPFERCCVVLEILLRDFLIKNKKRFWELLCCS